MKEDKNNRSAWLIVSNEENWNISNEKCVFGINSSPGRLKGIKEGDYYVTYLTGIGYVGWGKVMTGYYISNISIWENKSYRHRFGISRMASSGNILPGSAIKDDLEFITEKSRWAVHLKNGVTKISVEDYEKIVSGLKKSQTSYTKVEERIEKERFNPQVIGDELHDRMVKLFENSGFSILENNKHKEGPDIVIEDPLSVENSKIIIQCKNTAKNDVPTYASISKMIDEYVTKIKKKEAVLAIIIISGYKLPRGMDPIKVLENDKVALWTDDVVEYYEDLAGKISGFSKFQMLGDLGVHVSFDSSREYDAIEIKQNRYTYYVIAVEPDWLLKTTTVLRRINYSGTIAGYQRLLNRKRVTKDIPAYLDSGNWVFPNAIICTSKLDPEVKLVLKDGKLVLPSKYGIWWIIDGQHRLYAFANSDARLDSNTKILLTLVDSSSFGENNESEQASMFVNLNLHAKKVEKKLLIELHDVLGIRNPEVQIVFGLAKKPVFKDAIRGYSVKSGNINIATFAEDQSLKQFVSMCVKEEFNDTEKVIKRGINELNEYFSIVEEVFKSEWYDEEYILKTDRGVKGLLALYIKILNRYRNDKSSPKIVDVLRALKSSNIPLRIDQLKGEYLGAGGGKNFAKNMALYISKEIIGFEPSSKEVVVDHHISYPGDMSSLKRLESWLSKLEGTIRCQQMHIDLSTLEILRYLDPAKVKDIKVFFGDIVSDEAPATARELERMRGDGYSITLTRAQKHYNDGGFLHTRWVGDDKYCIATDSDLKVSAQKGSGTILKLSEWENSPQLKEFDDLWGLAERGFKGAKFEYDWNG